MWQRHRVIAVITPASLALLVLLLYGQSLTHRLVWDDEDNIVNNPALRQSPLAGGFLASPAAPTRLVANLSFAMEYRLWGLNPRGYHAVNLSLHFINTMLVYGLAIGLSLLRFARASPGPSANAVDRWGAWVAGVLFAVHPVHVETVNSIALGRGYLLATAFGLGALWLTAAAMRPEWNARRRWLWGGTLMALLCSIFSHEIGLVAILLVAILWLWQRRHEQHRGAISRAEIMGLTATGGVLVLLLLWVIGGARSVGGRFESLPLVGVLTVKQLVVPVPLCIWYDRLTIGQSGLLGSIAGAALIALLLLVGMTYAARDSVNILSLFLLLFALAPVFIRQMLPFPLPSVMGERWLYLPSALLALWVGLLVRPGWSVWGHGGGWGRIVAGIVVVLLGLAGVSGAVETAVQTRSWRDNVELFRHAVQHCPPSAYLRAALGKAYEDEGKIAQAKEEFLAAAAIDPNFSRARIGLGLVALDAGDPIAALREFSEAILLAPSDGDAHHGLGEVYFRLGRYEAAITEFQQAVALRPSASTYRRNLALALMKVDRLEEAIVAWKQVLAMTPHPDEQETAREEIEQLTQAVTRSRQR